MRVCLCVRADDRRTWFWRFGVKAPDCAVVVGRGAWRSSLRRVAGDALREGVEVWLWLGGALDDLIYSVLNSFGGAAGLMEFLEGSGFSGVLGPDTTVYWGDRSERNVRRARQHATAVTEFLEAAGGRGLRYVPQVKAVDARDLTEFLEAVKGAGAREVLYSAGFDLRDGLAGAVRITTEEARVKGLGLWLALPGRRAELELAKELGPNTVVLWRHLTRLAYPRRGNDVEREIKQLIKEIAPFKECEPYL